MEVPITSPDHRGSKRSALTFVTCTGSVNEGINTGNNGLILLEGSRAVLRRDTSYRFGDGSTASSAKPYSVISCGETSKGSQVDLSNVYGPDFQLRKLRVGKAFMEVSLTSPSGTGSTQSELLFVACAKSVVEGATSGINGYILTQGSKAVIVRDTSCRFGDGTSASAAAKYSVISCE